MSSGFAAILKQIAAMSKDVTVRTSGIIGDDLAINSKQLMGADSKRKLPMVFAVARGSLKNKAILIPTALALSVTIPWAIMPLLTLGGAYLCYDGIEKMLHKKAHDKQDETDRTLDPKALEKRKVKKAIKTDFILSAEIVVVSLWVAAAAPFIVQAGALAVAGIAMSVGVYGLVGAFIKMDDAGAALLGKTGKGILSKARRGLGHGLVKTSNPLIRTVGAVGTVAMFLVGGSMVMHGIPGGEHFVSHALNALTSSGLLQGALTMVAETAIGVAAGFVALLPMQKVIEPLIGKAVTLGKRVWGKINPFKKDKPPAPDGTSATPVTPAPKTEISAEPPKKTPDVKSDLNEAAQKPSKDTPPPAPAPVAPKQKKSPKIN